MEQLSFFEKLEILFQNILAHPFFICILLMPVFLILFNKKITKKAVVLIYISVLAIVLFIGNTTIFSLFDNLVDGVFMTLYFPNFVTLFIVEVASAIICLITFLKRDITKISKVINVTGFAIVQTIFALILTVIEANDIDIYQENALYASNDVLTLMQLLMGTFALQIITLLVVKGIEKVTVKLDGTDKEVLNKHVVKLPEGRITHVNLKDKVVIGKPQIIKEKEVVIKEPDVKIDPIKPQKPLDKTLLTNIKIKPIDVNEEIEKEKNKPMIKKETTEVLDSIKPKKEEAIVESKVLKEEKKDINPFDNFKPEFPGVSEPKVVKKESKEEKELITNLQIVDFEKMVDAIKNLSIIYTM
ncbi:MAG: hypothetical protein IKG40_03920 [Bacilli bacterium]|nr:hypothetical protein [Bacilli bacterium]